MYRQAHTHVYVHMYICICMYTMHVYSMYKYMYMKNHIIRRKEEGKEGRKKRTNTENLQQPRRLKNIYALPASCTCTQYTQRSTCTQYTCVHMYMYVYMYTVYTAEYMYIELVRVIEATEHSWCVWRGWQPEYASCHV